jgi:ribosome recycling factor
MDISQEFKKQLGGIFDFFKNEASAIRGSRPTPALVEDIQVECYGGQKMQIKQLGSISVIPPREIQITVWDMSVASAVAKTVGEKVNAQAAQEGTIIHINLPSLTDERRAELTKVIKNKAEEARIKSRNARDDIKKQITAQEKEGTITEDDKFSLQEDIQKELDTFNKNVDTLVEKKIEEINE